MTHEIEDFDADVINRSHETPVLVDFWAEWCGPCRMLGPVLEKLEGESEGAWVLRKVDVDSNQAIAQQYQVQGIPAVKLFVGGQVVAEFTGALPQAQVQHWLDSNLPGEDKALMEQAVALSQTGQDDEAKAVLETLLTEGPNEPASVLLAQLSMFDAPERAVELLEPVRLDSDHRATADDVKAIAGLLQRSADALEEHAVRDDYASGIEALRGRDYETALDRFITVLGRNKRYDDDGARKACIALFNFLGREHPLSVTFRRRFQSALN